MRAVTTLMNRELLRFVRQRSRMVGVIVSPVLFWIVIGSGLNISFHIPGGPEGLTYLEYFYPGTLVLVVLFASVFSSISIIEDRNAGFLQAVLVAPVSRLTIVLGKVLGMTALATVQGGLFLLAAPLVIPGASAGALVLTFIVLGIIALALSSLGFLIAWSMDSAQGFHVIMNLLLVPMWLLSGALFPMSGSTTWVAAVMQWNPLMYGVAAIRMSLYGLVPEAGQNLPEFAFSVTVLLVFWLGMVSLAVARVRVRKISSS